MITAAKQLYVYCCEKNDVEIIEKILKFSYENKRWKYYPMISNFFVVYLSEYIAADVKFCRMFCGCAKQNLEYANRINDKTRLFLKFQANFLLANICKSMNLKSDEEDELSYLETALHNMETYTGCVFKNQIPFEIVVEWSAIKNRLNLLYIFNYGGKGKEEARKRLDDSERQLRELKDNLFGNNRVQNRELQQLLIEHIYNWC
jgi:hypothetical protein